jgi:hypothetical protein
MVMCEGRMRNRWRYINGKEKPREGAKAINRYTSNRSVERVLAVYVRAAGETTH